MRTKWNELIFYTLLVGFSQVLDALYKLLVQRTGWDTDIILPGERFQKQILKKREEILK